MASPSDLLDTTHPWPAAAFTTTPVGSSIFCLWLYPTFQGLAFFRGLPQLCFTCTSASDNQSSFHSSAAPESTPTFFFSSSTAWVYSTRKGRSSVCPSCHTQWQANTLQPSQRWSELLDNWLKSLNWNLGWQITCNSAEDSPFPSSSMSLLCIPVSLNTPICSGNSCLQQRARQNQWRPLLQQLWHWVCGREQ